MLTKVLLDHSTPSQPNSWSQMYKQVYTRSPKPTQVSKPPYKLVSKNIIILDITFWEVLLYNSQLNNIYLKINEI